MHASMPAPSPLVGRDREFDILRRQLDAALAGHGSIVLISGEAGIGKTALAETLCQEAADGRALVLVGRCYDLTETPPYGPWVELFGRYRPANGPPLPAAFAERGMVGAVGSQSLLFQQVQDFLVTLATSRPKGTRPVLLLLDDLHWADPASRDLLRFLARAIASMPLLIVATYRTDELNRHHPLHALLPVLVRESRAERLELRPLGEQDLRELIGTRYPVGAADASRLIAYLHERAEGNPFFVGELLRTLEEGGTLHPADGGWALDDLTRLRVPPLLRQVIDGRLARLGEEAQSHLDVAAVIGQEVPLTIWPAVTGTSDEALLPIIDRAVEAHLLTETPDGLQVRFAHALIRQAVYEGVSPARRRLLHRRIAELLAEWPQPDPDAVAMHFERASDRRAIEWLVKAGERAQLAFARVTAAQRFEAALALLEGGDEDLGQRGWLRYRIARLRRYSTPRQSIEYLDEALRIAAATGDRALAAVARYSRGLCRLYESDDHNNAAVLAEMIAGCDALEALVPDDQERLGLGPDEHGLPTITSARGYLVLVLAENGRVAEALSLGEATRDGKPRHTPLGDVAWQSYGYRDAGLGTAYALAGRPAEARAAWERAHACYRDLGNFTTGNTLLIALLLVWLPYYTDQPDDLQRLADASEDAYRRRVSAAYDRLAHLPLLALAGRWAEAREGAETALQRTWGQRAFRGVAAVVLSDLCRAQGEPDAAWTVIRDAMPAGLQTPVGALIWFIGPPLLRVAASLVLDAGDLPTAKEWLDAHDHWLASSGAVLGASEGQTLWARYHRAAGDAAQAYQCAECALAHATEPRQPLALLAAHRLLGELDTDAGAHKEAGRHLGTSLALTDACQAPYERALTLLAMAEMERATGDRDAARALLDAVKAICEPLGAASALARVAALAGRMDTAPPAAVAYPAGLSAREVEVLRLVAEGLSNPQVGARLFLSPRTVEQHLRSVFHKTGVTSRVAAARWAADHALV